MGTRTAEIAVVVVTFGAHDTVRRNLTALGLAGLRASIIIVDNLHSGAERAALAALATEQGWEFLPQRANIGFGAAANVGVERATALGIETVLLLNPDATLDDDAMAALYSAAHARPDAIVAPRIARPDGSTWTRGNTMDLRTGRIRAADDTTLQQDGGWLSGACLMVSTRLWDRIGGFADDYFLYWEDVELSWRCREAGGSLSICDGASAVHEVGATQVGETHGSDKSDLYYYYNCRNRLVFAARNLPRRTVVSWMLSTPRESIMILRRGGGLRRLRRRPSAVLAAVRGSLVGLWIAALSVLAPPRRRRRRPAADPIEVRP